MIPISTCCNLSSHSFHLTRGRVSMSFHVCILPSLLIAAFLAGAGGDGGGSGVLTVSSQPKLIDFDREVKPIFAKHCVSCHGPDKQKNGLRLDRKAETASALVPGKSADSLLFQLVTGQDKDRPMPPMGQLSAAEIATLKAWIDEGAAWPDDGSGASKATDWWSFKQIKKPLVPAGVNPVDYFIRARLRDRGLSPSKEADRRTLIRRLYFDLIGLPPTPEEVEAFVDGRRRRTPTRSSSTGCWRRRTTASVGRGTGSTSCTTATRTATTRTSRGRTPGPTATT